MNGHDCGILRIPRKRMAPDPFPYETINLLNYAPIYFISCKKYSISHIELNATVYFFLVINTKEVHEEREKLT